MAHKRSARILNRSGHLRDELSPTPILSGLNSSAAYPALNWSLSPQTMANHVLASVGYAKRQAMSSENSQLYDDSVNSVIIAQHA